MSTLKSIAADAAKSIAAKMIQGKKEKTPTKAEKVDFTDYMRRGTSAKGPSVSKPLASVDAGAIADQWVRMLTGSS